MISLFSLSGVGRESQGARGERREGGEAAARREHNQGDVRRRPHAHMGRTPCNSLVTPFNFNDLLCNFSTFKFIYRVTMRP